MVKNDGKIIVTVHSDLVWKAAAVRLVWRKRRRYYYGNLDNVVCVAEVLRSVMPRVKDRRTKFYFTSEEESTMEGAKSVMKREGKALYIPIDVTTAARKADVNMEWLQHVDKRELKKALGKIPKLKIGFKTGHVDETMIFGKKYPTFSMNLPVDGRVHGRAKVSFWKARRFGRAAAEILRRIRKNYDSICVFEKKAA